MLCGLSWEKKGTHTMDGKITAMIGSLDGIKSISRQVAIYA